MRLQTRLMLAATTALAGAVFAIAPASQARAATIVAGHWVTDYKASGSVIESTWNPAVIGGKCLSFPADTTATVAGRLMLLHTDGTQYACADRISYATWLYGRFTARVWYPGSRHGIFDWPSFWLTSAGLYPALPWPEGGEIDITEALYGWPDHSESCSHYIFGTPSAHRHKLAGCYSGNGRGWHVWSVIWRPHCLRFSVDGHQSGFLHGSYIVTGVAEEVVFDVDNFVPGLDATMRVAWFRHDVWVP